ncbi:hypothetical protein SeLEV6574_g05725 [Synchytrium endobioticum]|uniref:Reverse transcriptase domain-containing protein n=1 Tax=Synchytrium endobioticum TaxID=286115 RepID=A0A507CSL3_9FUNG|nr:hypothetical protein SeLEV6574_g05725 [Synchytrium endobioticum]
MPIEGETHMAINTLKSIPTPKWTEKENQELPPKTWPYEEYPKLFDMELQRRLPPHRSGYNFDPKFKDDVTLPRNRPLFKLPKSQVELVDKYIDEELAEGKIIPSASLVAANLFFVPKADSTTELRPCVDYRDLNSCTVDDRYLMPAVSDLIQKLCGGDYYAKVDLRKAYNSIRVEEGKEWKLAFKCHRGTFQPLVMPFGPKIAPAVMQRFVNEKCQDFLKEVFKSEVLTSNPCPFYSSQHIM